MPDSDDQATARGRRTPPVPGSTAQLGQARADAGADGADPPAPPTTTSADGRYRLTGELARGGMGRVSRGVDDELGRAVAVKESLDRDPVVIARLLREAAITARLQHPSIVSLYDVARDDRGAPLLVMRLIDGRPLDQVIAGATTLDQRLALLPRVIPAVEAVAYAHRLGVVHRDLKPSNILVGELGDTVVIDWGLATFGADSPLATEGVTSAPEATLAGSVFGTPGFMAPEQARGETADHRADVFALGATLFYTLTGKKPFAGDSATRLIEAASRAAAIPLARAEPGVPRDLATIVDKALAHAAGDRYPTAERLAADLRDFLAGRLVSAHHYPLGQRLLRFGARHRAAVAAVTLAAIVVAAVATVAVRRVVAARDRARAALADATAARAAETARADELIESQAEAVLATDPTRAVALLALRSRRGDAVERALLADAVGRGVAHSWPAHDGLITGLAWMPGGLAAITVGWDRTVRWHDAAGRSRELRRFDDGPVVGPALIDGGAAVGGPGRIVVFDETGAVRAEWPSADAPTALIGGGGWVAWSDPGGLHVREVAHGPVRDLPGDQLGAIEDRTATWIFGDGERVQAMALRTGAIRELGRGRLEDVAPDRPSALVRSGDELIELRIDPTVDEPDRRWPIAAAEVAMYADGAPIALGGTTLRRLGGAEIPLPTGGLGLTTTGPGVLAIAHGRDVALIGRHRIAWVRGNPAPVTRMAVSPGGDALLCATFDGRLTRWPLVTRASAITELTDRDVNQLAAIDPTHYVAVDADGGAAVMSVGPEPSRFQPHPEVTRLLSFTRYLRAGDALVLLGPDGEVRVARGAPPFAVARGVKVMAPLDDGAIATLTEDGAIARVALTPGAAAQSLGHLGAAGRGLYQRAGTLLALGDGGALWRRRADGTLDTAALGRPVTGAAYLLADGTALVGVRGGVVRWPIDGPPVARATLAGDPLDLREDGGRLLVTLDGGAVWGERGGALVPVLAGDANRLLPALSPLRVVYVEGGTRVLAIEPDSGVVSELPIDAGFITSVIALEDGRTVVVAGDGKVYPWRDPVPAEPAAFAAWRERLTNATLAGPRAALSWR